MNYRFTKTCVLALLLAASTAQAATDAGAKGGKAGTATPERRHVLVDINSASKAELMKQLGLGDAEAEGIVAGRPYGSKAMLVTRKILTTGVYLNIKSRIVARQK